MENYFAMEKPLQKKTFLLNLGIFILRCGTKKAEHMNTFVNTRVSMTSKRSGIPVENRVSDGFKTIRILKLKRRNSKWKKE